MKINDLCDDHPMIKIINDYVEYIKTFRNLQSVYNYYKENKLSHYDKLHYKPVHPTQYMYIIYCVIKNKYYIGETLDCFDRVKDYFNKGSINNELKDDLINYGLDCFKYWLIPCEDGVFLQNKKIKDAERKGVKLYNIVKADPSKSKKKSRRVTKKQAKEVDFKGIGDLWDTIGGNEKT